MEKKKRNVSSQAPLDGQGTDPKGPTSGEESGPPQEIDVDNTHNQGLFPNNELESQNTKTPNHQDLGTTNEDAPQSAPQKFNDQDIPYDQAFVQDDDWNEVQKQQNPVRDPSSQAQGDQLMEEADPRRKKHVEFSQYIEENPRRELSTLDELSEEEDNLDQHSAQYNSLEEYPEKGNNTLDSNIIDENGTNTLPAQTIHRDTELSPMYTDSNDKFEKVHNSQASTPIEQRINPQQNVWDPSSQLAAQSGETKNQDLHVFNVNMDDDLLRKLKIYIDGEIDKKLPEGLGKNTKKTKYSNHQQETGENSQEVPLPPYPANQGKTTVKDSLKSGLQYLKGKFEHKPTSSEHEDSTYPQASNQGEHPQLSPNLSQRNENDFMDPQTGLHSDRFALLDENGNIIHNNSPPSQHSPHQELNNDANQALTLQGHEQHPGTQQLQIDSQGQHMASAQLSHGPLVPYHAPDGTVIYPQHVTQQLAQQQPQSQAVTTQLPSQSSALTLNQSLIRHPQNNYYDVEVEDITDQDETDQGLVQAPQQHQQQQNMLVPYNPNANQIQRL